MLKQVRFLTILCVLLAAVAAAPAIPKAIEIPEALLDGKLLGKHRQQIHDRVEWWKKSLLAAQTDEDIQRAGEKLLDDYRLYPQATYQQAFAEETLQQYTDVLTGKAFAPDDPLRTLKRINAALVLAKMEQPNLQPAMRILVSDKNEALRFLGWQGYLALRRGVLAGDAKARAGFLEDVRKAVAEETNPILLAAVYRAMHLQEVRKIDEKHRREAERGFLEALRSSWALRCKQARDVGKDGGELLSSLRLAVSALRGIGEDCSRVSPRDDAGITLCLQMVFDMAAAAAQTYDRVWQNRSDSALLESCTALLQTCEEALNILAGAKQEFLAEKINPRNTVPDRGAAVLEAVLVRWAEVLKDKGVRLSAAPGN